MKICQINCIYGIGSTGKIVRDLHLALLKDGYDSLVICPEQNQYTNEGGIYTISNKFLHYNSAVYRRLFGRQFDGAFLQTNRILKILKEEKPDLVHLHCINGNDINVYRLLRYLAVTKIKTVLTLHAEFPYTGGCGHAYECEKWKNGCGHCPILLEATQSILLDGTKHTWRAQNSTYRLFDKNNLYITAVSPWLLSRAKQSPMLQNFEMQAIYNPVNTEVYKYNDDQYIRDQFKLSKSKPIVLHVTANFDTLHDNLKGGKYILELANKYKNDNVQFVVASNHCQIGSLPDNVTYIGKIENSQDLAKLYSTSNITLIASKRETFSMITAESLCCGTPVIGFEAGGPESICIPEYSKFVPYGNINLLKNACDFFLENAMDKAIIAQKAKQVYDVKKIILDYENLYQSIK